MNYEYKCKVVRIIDADTLAVAVDLGCDVTINLTIRLYGIDAPERGTVEGVAATKFVFAWLGTRADDLMLTTIKDKKEKYGRYLGIIKADDGTLNKALIDNGHATWKGAPGG